MSLMVIVVNPSDSTKKIKEIFILYLGHTTIALPSIMVIQLCLLGIFLLQVTCKICSQSLAIMWWNTLQKSILLTYLHEPGGTQ